MNPGKLTAAALLALAVLSAHAADGPYISPTSDRVRITLGVMQSSSSTSLRVDSTAGVPGTPIDAEQDLSLDRKRTDPKFQAMIRVSERHRLRFDYLTLERNGFRNIDKPISFRNENLLAGDPVNSQLGMRMLGISYGYSFIHGERFELAGTFGANLLDLSARARVQEPNRHIDQREDKAGPFPTIGLDTTWVISKRFHMDARIQYLKLNIDQINGSFGVYELAALYRWRANVSLGLGYHQERARLTSTKPTESGFFDFDSRGPEMFVRVAF